MSEQRRAALYYSARDLPVFPVRHNKVPLTEHGFLDATTDQRQVSHWWTRWPKASIGIACGHGCDVLDVDGPEGRASLATLLAEHDQDPAILAAWAASSSGRPDGGTHYWFAPGGPSRRLGFRPHLDWLGLRGYCIAPPSVHPSGRTYRWRDGMAPVELPTAPTWLHAAATRPAPERRPRPRRSLPFLPERRGYWQAALAGEVEQLRQTSAGHCHGELVLAATRVGSLYHLGMTDQDVDRIVEDLADAALTNAAEPKDRAKALKTARECFDNGKAYRRFSKGRAS